MKKLKLIYNPNSGDRTFKNSLDDYIAAFALAGYETHPFRSMEKGDIAAHINSLPLDYYDIMAVAGGDGTFNLALNAVLTCGHNMPLLIIPSGTANDFSNFLGMPINPKEITQILLDGKIVWSDVGLANESYFINVCAAGLFTTVSQQVDSGIKSTLGKLAYYLKSLEQIPSFEPISVNITNSENSFTEEIFLFLTLNSSGTGGFDKLAPLANISDGLFEFVAVKACPMLELGKLFIKVLKSDWLNDPNIIYFQDNFVKIELLNDKQDCCDIDGEHGPKLPIEIRNIHKRIPLYVP